MAELFADLPEAIANTLGDRPALRVRARRKRKPILPSLAGDLEAEARAAAPRRARRAGRRGWPATPTSREDERKAYLDRLEYELDVITGMGFPGYFLIVADFIKWAKAQRHSGRARAAARAPARSSPGR